MRRARDRMSAANLFPPPPMKTRTPRQAARRDRILAAARGLIAQQGYDGLTMRDLANSANVSPTTLYNLYENKDALVLAAVADLLAHTRETLEKRFPDPGYEQILASVDLQAQQIERTPEYAAAMTRALFQAPPVHPLVRSLLWSGSRQMLHSLQAMQRANQLRADTDMSHLARVLTGAPWSSMLLWSKGLLPLAELRRTLRDTMLAILIAHAQPATRRVLQERLAAPAHGAED
jgi:AcrR family transcriptional regulator